MSIFLGGTCNNSTWRDILIKYLKKDYFNPVVKNWNEKAQKKEEYEKENADINLYVITPKMKGVYSIAEVVQDSNDKPFITILMLCNKDGDDIFDEFQWKSLQQVSRIVEKNKSIVLVNDFLSLIEILNKQKLNFEDEIDIYNDFIKNGFYTKKRIRI